MGTLGYKHSEEAKRKISESLKGKNHQRLGKTFEQIVGIEKAAVWKKRISIVTQGEKNPNYGNGEKISGDKNPMFGIDRSGDKSPSFGKPRPDQSERMRKSNPMRMPGIAQKVSRTMIETGCNAGENASNWQGGISFEPYGIEFNKELKLFIRQRDNYTCQFCGVGEDGKIFDSHHIDYDKKNNDVWNFILLCRSCHAKTNIDRAKWQFLFETLQEIRGVGNEIQNIH